MTPSPRSGSSSGNNQPRGGKPRSGAPKAGGFKSGAPKSGGFKSGAPKAGGSKPGARKPSQSGARPYNNEQYGRTVSSSKNRPTEQNRRPERTTDDIDIHNAEGVRLQKVMAMAGVASRRLCEDMILEGRVQVDGVTVNQLGLRVDPETVEIAVDGMTIQTNYSMVYMVFNKPAALSPPWTTPRAARASATS
jgi:23S rRNA pseudouridine2605 synthase